MGRHNHWVPGSKTELVKALMKRYPGDKKFRRMAKKQLYAVWFRLWTHCCPACR